MSALRTGKRERPSYDLLEALARFFGVTTAYFFDRDHADQAVKQLAMLHEIRKLQGLPEIDD